MLDRVLAFLDGQKEAVVDIQRKLVAIPALGPDNQGDGERKKADCLKALLKNYGLSDVAEVNAPDSRVSCGHRPNLIATVSGTDAARTFWTLAHMDVVPPGDRTLWKTNPYELAVEGDWVYGRGVADNHQGLVASVILAKALRELKIEPPMGYGMLFVSDEETGSAFGAEYVLENRPELFRKQDLFFVPDVGLPPDEIEIAEKSALWLKIIVSGKQSHAAHPEKGNNSLVAASAFVVKLRELYEVFAEKDLLFSPPISTFEPTKKEANVENVNTVPGRDVFYVDCRLLPQHGLKEVRAEIERRGAEIEAKYGVTIAYEDAKSDQRPAAISTDEEIVKRLSRAIEGVMGKTPRCVGIGGGTVAAILRKKGFPAAGWDPSDFAHEPNERSSVSMTIAVAKVMARALWGGRRIYLNGKNNGGRGMFAFRAILLGALKDIVTPENLPLGKFVRGPVRDSEKILFQKEAATTSKTA